MDKRVLIISKSDLFKSAAVASDLALAVLEVANGNARSFTYGASDLIRIARIAEKRMDQGSILQSDRIGFTISARSAGPAAAAYKNSAIGTTIVLRRSAKGWVLVSAERATIYPRMNEKVTFSAPDRLVETFRERSTFDIAAIAA